MKAKFAGQTSSTVAGIHTSIFRPNYDLSQTSATTSAYTSRCDCVSSPKPVKHKIWEYPCIIKKEYITGIFSTQRPVEQSADATLHTGWRAPSWSIMDNEDSPKLESTPWCIIADTHMASFHPTTNRTSHDHTSRDFSVNFLGFDGGTSIPQSTDFGYHGEALFTTTIKDQDQHIKKEAKILGTLLRPGTGDFVKPPVRKETIDLLQEMPYDVNRSKLKNTSSPIKRQLSRLASIVSIPAKEPTTKRKFHNLYGCLPLPGWKKNKQDTIGQEPDSESSESFRFPQYMLTPLPFPEVTHPAYRMTNEPKPSEAVPVKVDSISDRPVSPVPTAVNLETKEKLKLKLENLPRPQLATQPRSEDSSLDCPSIISSLRSQSPSPCYFAGEASRFETPSVIPMLPEYMTRRNSVSSVYRSSSMPGYFDLPRSTTYPIAKRNRHNTSPEVLSQSSNTSGKDVENDDISPLHESTEGTSKDEFVYGGAFFKLPGFARVPNTKDIGLFPNFSSVSEKKLSPGTLEDSQINASHEIQPATLLARRGSLPEKPTVSPEELSERKLSHSSSTSQLDNKVIKDAGLFDTSNILLQSLPNKRHRRTSAAHGRGAIYSLAIDHLLDIHQEAVNTQKTPPGIELVPWRGMMITQQEHKALSIFLKPISKDFRPDGSSVSEKPTMQESPRLSKLHLIDTTTQQTHQRPYVPKSNVSTHTQDSDSSDDSKALAEGTLYAEVCHELSGITPKLRRKPHKLYGPGYTTSSSHSLSTDTKRKLKPDFITLASPETAVWESSDNDDDDNDEKYKSIAMLYSHVLKRNPSAHETQRKESVEGYQRRITRAPSLPIISRRIDLDFITTSQQHVERSKTDGLLTTSAKSQLSRLRQRFIVTFVSKVIEPFLHQIYHRKNMIESTPKPVLQAEQPDVAELPIGSQHSLRTYLARDNEQSSQSTSEHDIPMGRLRNQSKGHMVILGTLIHDAGRNGNDGTSDC